MGLTDRCDVDQELQERGHRGTSILEWRALEADAVSLTAPELADELERLRELDRAERRSRRPIPDKVDESLGYRQDALEEWAYRLASTNPAVVAWRSTHDLVEFDQLSGWFLFRRAEEQAEHRNQLRQVVTRFDVLGESRGPRLQRLTTLYWSMPGKDPRDLILGSEHVRLEGDLGRLATLSEDLAADFGWHVGDATSFVVCGFKPDVLPIFPTYTRGYRQVLDRDLTIDAFDRVSAVLDPYLTPEQVAEWWGRVRLELGVSRPGKRTKKRDQKTAALAALSHEDEQTWPERLGAWNEKHPEWRFETSGNGPWNFANAVNEARRWLLHVGTSDDEPTTDENAGNHDDGT